MEIPQWMKKKDGQMMIRHQVDQNILEAVRDELGPDTTPVDCYVHCIKQIMVNDGLSIQDTKEAMENVHEGKYLNEVLEAISKIEIEGQEIAGK
jgi:isochorismate hydrolase